MGCSKGRASRDVRPSTPHHTTKKRAQSNAPAPSPARSRRTARSSPGRCGRPSRRRPGRACGPLPAARSRGTCAPARSPGWSGAGSVVGVWYIWAGFERYGSAHHKWRIDPRPKPNQPRPNLRYGPCRCRRAGRRSHPCPPPRPPRCTPGSARASSPRPRRRPRGGAGAGSRTETAGSRRSACAARPCTRRRGGCLCAVVGVVGLERGVGQIVGPADHTHLPRTTFQSINQRQTNNTTHRGRGRGTSGRGASASSP